tara:strand:- start:499 stop:1674 length:1176 start_codon:yes stop_codon:yes gene_type:complete
MTQPQDYVVDNDTGANVRTDLNNLFEAIRQNNGYGTEPIQKYNYMWYANTVSDRMSFYKANASDRVEFISLTNGNFFGPNGSASSPSYTFTSSTSTGFFSPTSNQIGVSNGGSTTTVFKPGLIEVDGNLVLERNTADTQVQISAFGVGHNAALDLAAHSSTYSDYGLRLERQDGINAVSKLEHRGTGNLEIIAKDGGEIKFKLGDISNNTSVLRWKFNAAGAFVWNEHIGGGSPISGDILPRGIVSKQGIAANATTASLYNFYWTGTGLQMWIDGSNQGIVSVSSDYRVKKNITTQTASGIDKIKQLRPVNYEFTDNESLCFKKDGVERVGFIAHEVAEVIPSAVDGEKDAADSVQSLRTIEIVSVLTKALQEAVAKIETLEAKVAALEAS